MQRISSLLNLWELYIKKDPELTKVLIGNEKMFYLDHIFH